MNRLPPAFAKHLKLGLEPQRSSTRLTKGQGPSPVNPGVEAVLRRAKEHHDRGEFSKAEKLCVAVLARHPNNPQALLLAGNLARDIGDLGLAMNLFKKVLAVQPNSAETQFLLASTCEAARLFDSAIHHFEAGLKIKPHAAHALRGLGRSYVGIGNITSALPLYEKATKRHPNDPVLRYDYATALISIGRMDEAARLLRENIEQRVLVSSSYLSLSDTRKFSEEPVELGEILSVLKSPDLSSNDKKNLHLAAGKILNDIGCHDEAVDHFQASKIESGHDFDLGAFSHKVDTLIASFTPQMLQSKVGFGNPSQVPVFIVGMPRSGTTLTEQICASHPAVHGAGELIQFNLAVRHAGYADNTGTEIRKPFQAITAHEAQSISTSYLGFLQSLAPQAARIVDKMPHNFLQIGMIAIAFPNARIVHCTRDAIDNCVSCFFNSFNENHGYNTDLEKLGLYYREYYRLMQHWHALLPSRIHECNYEKMTTNQEGESRRLIDFLGLPWDDACLRFHETDRSVITPSRWQVRQPIYQSSVKRWKKYEHKIQPLIEALGDLADV